MVFKIFKTILAVLLYLLLAAMVLTVAGVILILPRMICTPPWPWWQCVALLGGIIGFIVFCVLGVRWWRRHREIKRLKNVNQPQPEMEQAMQADRIRRKWREFLVSIKGSRLNLRGRAVDALPWYMMIGAPQSAKSSTIEGSGLTYDLGGQKEDGQGIGCDFWCMRDMLLIEADTTLNDTPASGFSNLLSHVYSSRSKEPINGIIVTVGADQLVTDKFEDLQNYAQKIRAMLETLMLRFSAQIPVYVFISKIDMLPGMRELATVLPEEALSQTMGCLNEDITSGAGVFFEDAADKISRQLKDLRLMLLYQNARTRPALMLAPDEVSMLLPGLRHFVRGVFQENPYQHTPVARGLFMGSAGAQGAIITRHLHELNIQTVGNSGEASEEDSEGVAKRENPMFLGEFFSRIAPADRNFYKPLPEFIRWESIKKNKSALAAMAVVTSLILLMSAAFMQTMIRFRDFRELALQTEIPTGKADLANSMIALNEYNSLLKKCSTNISDLWFDRIFLFNQPEDLQTAMQRNYAQKFEQGILLPLDGLINKNYPPFAKDCTAEALGMYFEYLVRTINLCRAAGNSTLGEKDFAGKLPPPTSGILFTAGADVGPDIAIMLPDLFKRYYLCSEGNPQLLARAQVQTGELVTLLERGPDSLSWIVAWANMSRDVSDITMADFWGKTLIENSTGYPWVKNCVIKRAYTNAGRVQILGLLAQLTDCINNAGIDPLQRKGINTVITRRAQTFFGTYKNETYNAWLCFARQLPGGKALLASEDQLKEYAGKSAVLAGPYMGFIDKCSSELMAFASNDLNQLPQWMGLVLKIKAIRRSLPAVQMLGSSASKVSQIAAWAGNIASTVASKTGVPTRPTKKLRPENIFLNYCNGLWKSGPAPGNVSRQTAYFNLASLYEIQKKKVAGPDAKQAAQKPKPPAKGEEQAQGGTPIAIAYSSYVGLKKALGGESASDSEAVVWSLVRGPFDLVLEYNCYETGRYLQSAWQGIVMNGIDAIPEVSRPEIIFKKDSGRIWKWVSTVAAPFIAKDSSGSYFPVAVYNKTIPFRPDVIEMLTKAEKGAWGLQAQYAVNINALPIDVNPRAQTLPDEVMLTLNTSEGPQVLKNLNYPVAKKYKWKPKEGGRTQLRIEFDGVSLIRTYEGPYGFARFIKDFSDGVHTFTPEDFPDSESMLKNMCISYIDIKYFFDPGEIEQLLLLNDLLGIKVPYNVCSDYSQWRSDCLKSTEELKWQCCSNDGGAAKGVYAGTGKKPQNSVKVEPVKPDSAPHKTPADKSAAQNPAPAADCPCAATQPASGTAAAKQPTDSHRHPEVSHSNKPANQVAAADKATPKNTGGVNLCAGRDPDNRAVDYNDFNRRDVAEEIAEKKNPAQDATEEKSFEPVVTPVKPEAEAHNTSDKTAAFVELDVFPDAAMMAEDRFEFFKDDVQTGKNTSVVAVEKEIEQIIDAVPVVGVKTPYKEKAAVNDDSIDLFDMIIKEDNLLLPDMDIDLSTAKSHEAEKPIMTPTHEIVSGDQVQANIENAKKDPIDNAKLKEFDLDEIDQILSDLYEASDKPSLPVKATENTAETKPKKIQEQLPEDTVIIPGIPDVM